MKVLYVTPVGERGGVESVLINILSTIDRTRFVPLVVVLQNGPFVKEIEATGAEVEVVEAGRIRQVSRMWKAIWKIVELIRSRHVEIVHCQNAKASIYGGIAARIVGVPSIYHLHGVRRFSLNRDGFVNFMSKMLKPTVVIPCSAFVARSLARDWQTHPEIVLVHNGCPPTPREERISRRVRTEFGIPDQAPLVVTATRLQRGKGVHVLVRAAAEVVKVCPEVRFLVVGGALFGLDTSYPSELERMLESEQLNGNVQLVGFQKDVLPFYLEADIVVHPAIVPEAFGMVILEAMSCAKPVVATSGGGVVEIVEHGTTGLLVRPSCPAELARAILALLSDPARRGEMGEAGAARFQKEFTARRMAAKLETLYADLERNNRKAS